MKDLLRETEKNLYMRYMEIERFPARRQGIHNLENCHNLLSASEGEFVGDPKDRQTDDIGALRALKEIERSM